MPSRITDFRSEEDAVTVGLLDGIRASSAILIDRIPRPEHMPDCVREALERLVTQDDLRQIILLACEQHERREHPGRTGWGAPKDCAHGGDEKDGALEEVQGEYPCDLSAEQIAERLTMLEVMIAQANGKDLPYLNATFQRLLDVQVRRDLEPAQ